MPQVIVVYHSGYGHTQRMAQAVADGAGAELMPIDADGNLAAGSWDRLNAADAIIFGSPTYMGSVSWQFKKFADTSSKAATRRGRSWVVPVFSSAAICSTVSMGIDKLTPAVPNGPTTVRRFMPMMAPLAFSKGPPELPGLSAR